MSSSTKNIPTPSVQEFNLAPPVPSPTTISENCQTPGFEDILAEPATSPTPPKQGSSRVEKDMGNSPKISQPSVLESSGPQHVPTPFPGSANSEKVMDNSSENSHLPGCKKSIPETLPSAPPHIPGRSPQPHTSGPPNWKHTSPSPSTLEEYSQNIENVAISPNNSHPPGWDDIVLGSAPPASAMPGSSSMEKDTSSSPEISQPPGWENFSSQHIPAPLPGMSQLVCGSCRQLLSYPQSITHVKCPCCQIINFVLEEHQVGTVKCAKCWVWLMYPHGAPSVICSACRFVTQIGEDNARPPLSVQQNRSFVSPSPLR